MANSRLRVETKAITEGAVMASLTAVLALAGIFIPVINPIVMLIWTLPVVVICIRHGMKAGVATIAVAGILILIIATPVNAFNMLLCSVGPALFIGGGFHYKWSTEKTILYTAAAAAMGLAADLLISSWVMGVSVMRMFTFDPELFEEVAGMIRDSGLMSSMFDSQEELLESVREMFDTMHLMIPAALAIYGLFTALTNYAVARIVLRRLKEQVPPLTKLSTFRLPMPFLLGFITGFGILILCGTYFTDNILLMAAGQNITGVFMVLYAFQGFGLAFYYIGKFAPQMQSTFRFILIFGILLTGFNSLMFISYAGVIDAFFDFRKLDIGSLRM